MTSARACGLNDAIPARAPTRDAWARVHRAVRLLQPLAVDGVGCKQVVVRADRVRLSMARRCSNRAVFMNSALNTEVGSLNRIEYLTLSTNQFYSSASAITHYSRVPFRISPPCSALVLPPAYMCAMGGEPLWPASQLSPSSSTSSSTWPACT